MLIQGEHTRHSIGRGFSGQFTIIRNGLCEGVYCDKDDIPLHMRNMELYGHGQTLFVLYANHTDMRLDDKTLIALLVCAYTALYWAAITWGTTKRSAIYAPLWVYPMTGKPSRCDTCKHYIKLPDYQRKGRCAAPTARGFYVLVANSANRECWEKKDGAAR